jgi:dolichol-phosphate mannosyltransferase
MPQHLADSDSPSTLISVVVPCFNEDAVIKATYSGLVQSLSVIPEADFELIFVDDGSRDHTLAQLKRLQAADQRVRVVSFSRNFGHQAAVTAGIEHASGEAVVLIDADLQDPPEVIVDMVTAWRGGADVVYGCRTEREGETAFKLWTAKAFYRTINRLSNIAIPLDTGDFRLMDRKVVDALLNMPEHDRFIRGMVAWLGFRQQPVHYKRAERFAGETKYPLRRMIQFAIDGILSFSLTPLRLAIWLGLGTATLAILTTLYALAVRLLTNVWVPGWTFLIIVICTLGGIQLVFLGIIGEYVGRIYGEAKQRPLYVVSERIGFSTIRPGAYSRRKGTIGSAATHV